MLFIHLLITASALSVQAHPASQHHDHDHEHERGDSATIQRVLDSSLSVIGGIETLNKIQSFTYSASSIFRSHTLGQNYNLFPADQTVATSGSQNISFFSSNGVLKTRIDRAYDYGYYWSWGQPTLEPGIDMSVVIQDGSDAFACFNKGQNSFYADDPSVALGYTDGFLSDYLVHQSHQFALPWLLREFMEHTDKLRLSYEADPITGAKYITLEHLDLELSILIDTKSNLPTIIRSHEVHTVYGKSTSDLVLTAWHHIPLYENSTDTIFHPHRFQTVYNSQAVLEDFIIDSISINPNLASDFFDARPPPPNPDMFQFQIRNNSKPQKSNEYPRSEVHEFYESGLWGGPFGAVFNTSDVKVTYPVPGVEHIKAIHVGYADYVQLLVEFEDGFLITDAPAHRSKIILDWVDETMGGKRVKYVVPSHHHRDHAGGVPDYVAAGAILVIPEIAKDLYTITSPGARIETYSASKPFVKGDGNVHFASYFGVENPHAADWTFAIAAPTNARDDEFVLYDADVINPGTDALRWDTGAARELLNRVIRVGLPKAAKLVGSHGSTMNGTSTTDEVLHVAETIGFVYPSLTAEDYHLKSKRT